MTVQFIGATEGVTGSKHLVTTPSGRKILLDCGLYQGKGSETGILNRHLGFDPVSISEVILSHAHIDHSGNLPFLVKQGFSGPIYCTPGTYDVCALLLIDSANIHERDVEFINRKRREEGRPPIEPLYTVKDAEKCLRQFRQVGFDTDYRLSEDASFYFSPNGHIIGSGAVNLSLGSGARTVRLTFTGDIGRYNDPLLRPPAVFQQSDYIICESTYGDRLHEPNALAEEQLLAVIRDTLLEKKGRLIIPAFSLGRTQEILYLMDRMSNNGQLPAVEVFVDSPLSTGATRVARSHRHSFNDALQAYLSKDQDPFGFPGLTYIEDQKESMRLNEKKNPCVIISASGMADAGRVKHHIMHAIEDRRNTILITGFCAEGTLGRKLADGERSVSIFGEPKEVNAEIRSILSLSAHADYQEMLKYLSCQTPAKVKKVFLVHGEKEAKKVFSGHLRNAGFPDVVIPSRGETFEL